MLEGNVQQVVKKRLGIQAKLIVLDRCARLVERCDSLVFCPTKNLQTSAIGHNALEGNISALANFRQGLVVACNELVKIAELDNQLLHQRFQAQQLDSA